MYVNTYFIEYYGYSSLLLEVCLKRRLRPLFILKGHLTQVQRVHRDVSHHSKLTAVVEVLVLETEKVPDEASVA